MILNPICPNWSIQHSSPNAKYMRTSIVIPISEVIAGKIWGVQWQNINEKLMPYLPIWKVRNVTVMQPFCQVLRRDR